MRTRIWKCGDLGILKWIRFRKNGVGGVDTLLPSSFVVPSLFGTSGCDGITAAYGVLQHSHDPSSFPPALAQATL